MYAAADASSQHGVSACWLITGATGYAPSKERSMGLVSPPAPPPSPPPAPPPPPEYGAVLHAVATTSTTFRLSVRFRGEDPLTPIKSPMLRGGAVAPVARSVRWDGMRGVATAHGALLVSDGEDPRWELRDANNATVVSGSAPLLDFARAPGGTVAMAVRGTGGAALDETYWPRDTYNGPCLSNGQFTPPFYWENTTGLFAFVLPRQSAAAGDAHALELRGCSTRLRRHRRPARGHVTQREPACVLSGMRRRPQWSLRAVGIRPQ